MSLAVHVKAEIAAALGAAPRGRRTATAVALAGRWQVSVATVYRCAQLGGTARRRDAARPEYRAWVRVAVDLAQRGPAPLSLDLALAAAVEAGLVPQEAAAMPLATAHRVAREMGLRPPRRRRHRIHADYPMQAVQIDGSSSQHLTAVRELADGDWLLRMHRRPWSAGGYKNKPLASHRQRVLVYALWDICTGLVRSEYTVARGETALDTLAFLCRALQRHEDPRVVLHGIPDDLWSDQGGAWKSAAGRDLLARLGIAVVTGLPYQKERMGGVERSHRTRWGRFERALFLRRSGEIRLSELNARLVAFEADENARRQSRTLVGGRQVSRALAWQALLSARPRPLREMPADALATAAIEGRRQLDVNGVLRWQGAEYECGWHDRWVVVRQSLTQRERLVVECEASGERREAIPLRRRSYGEIRAAGATPLDRLIAEAPAAGGHADLWAPDRPRAGSGDSVVALVPPSAPAAPLADPLATGADLAAAMATFVRHWPQALTPGQKARVEARLAAAADPLREAIDLANALTTATRRTS